MTSDRALPSTRLSAAGIAGASVAHELRNALAVASSSIFLARRDAGEPARLLEHLGLADAQVRRAQDIVGAVLSLARGEAPAQEANRADALVRSALTGIVAAPSQTITTEIAPPELVVRCSATLLERVVGNLVQNAVAALEGRSQGRVVVRIWQEPETAAPSGSTASPRTWMCVEDDGPGIDPAIVDTLFEPLATTNEKGTGLGLLFCRAAVEAHGGRIVADSSPLGGARFTLFIPG